jgi:hypothetical protein
MPKERGYNPVQEQRKADKAKAIKKGTHSPLPPRPWPLTSNPPNRKGRCPSASQRKARPAKSRPHPEAGRRPQGDQRGRR